LKSANDALTAQSSQSSAQLRKSLKDAEDKAAAIATTLAESQATLKRRDDEAKERDIQLAASKRVLFYFVLFSSMYCFLGYVVMDVIINHSHWMVQ
jgi:zona occludens toxin (predicted ATPase)